MVRIAAFVCPMAISMALALGGCGGGGGVGAGPVEAPPKTPEPPPPQPLGQCIPLHDGDCVTAEAFEQSATDLVGDHTGETGFTNQWGLGHMNTGRAYANLELLKGDNAEPGAGVTIGFIDTGIDQSHPVFSGKTVTEQWLSGAVDETGARFSHGTAVASVAAAARVSSSSAAWGVASGANIAMFSIPTGSGGGGGYYVPISLAALDSINNRWTSDFNTVLAWRSGVDILNLSLGYSGIIDNYTEQQIRANLGSAVAAMAQAGASEKTLFVWGAGNAHGDLCTEDTPNCEGGRINAVSVEVMPGLAARIPELRGHTVAVVALTSDGIIAPFSNRCGIAAAYCIAAPGSAVTVAYHGPHRDTNEPHRGYATGRGTSYSAPMVAGGLALMKQLFRDQLSNAELVSRLFETADDGGAYSDSAVYGHGAVDLGAATSPVGVLEMPGDRNAGGGGFRLLSTRLLPGAPFGDGLQRSLAAREVMALDALGAPFWYRLDHFTAAAGGPSVAARLRRFLASAPLRGGHMALAERAVAATLAGPDGFSATGFTTTEVPGQKPTLGAALTWRRPGSPLGLRAGWIGEPKTLLGSVGEGAFGALAADTTFVGADAHADLAGWRVGATAEFGIVVPEARGGFVDGVSSLATSAFTLDASRALAGAGAVRFSVSQPLRVERGRAALRVPAGRTQAGAVWHDAVSAGLAPSGRQVDFASEWSRPLPKGELRLGAVYSHRPGHRRDAGPELTFLGGWRWRF